MPLSEAVKDQVFARSSGRCECTRYHTGFTGVIHQHVRCPNTFQRREGWEARYKISELAGGSATADNCEVLCLTCYQLP